MSEASRETVSGALAAPEPCESPCPVLHLTAGSRQSVDVAPALTVDPQRGLVSCEAVLRTVHFWNALDGGRWALFGYGICDETH